MRDQFRNFFRFCHCFFSRSFFRLQNTKHFKDDQFLSPLHIHTPSGKILINVSLLLVALVNGVIRIKIPFTLWGGEKNLRLSNNNAEQLKNDDNEYRSNGKCSMVSHRAEITSMEKQWKFFQPLISHLQSSLQCAKHTSNDIKKAFQYQFAPPSRAIIEKAFASRK